MYRRLRHVLIAALVFALSMPVAGTPRHAKAAMSGHSSGVVEKATHDHDAGHRHGNHSHDQSLNHHDDGKAQPVSGADQSCCVAWCVTIAIVADAEPLVCPAIGRDFAPRLAHFHLTANHAAIDPPPR